MDRGLVFPQSHTTSYGTSDTPVVTRALRNNVGEEMSRSRKTGKISQRHICITSVEQTQIQNDFKYSTHFLCFILMHFYNGCLYPPISNQTYRDKSTDLVQNWNGNI